MAPPRQRLRIDGETVPSFAPSVVLRHDRARARWVLVAPSRAMLPDAQATAILQLVDGLRAVDDIVDEVSRRYETPRQAAAEEVVALLQDLADRGVIEV